MLLVPLIGWKPTSAPTIALSFVASAISNAGTITIPAGAQAGDFAILFDRTIGASKSGGVPTNWDNILNEGGGNALIVSRKLLVGGDPGASISGYTGATSTHKVMFVFRPSAPISTVTVSTWTFEQTGGDPASQSILASGQAVPLIVFGVAGAVNSAPSFTTASPAFDAEVANGSDRVRAGYKIYNTSPADHTIDMGDTGTSNALAGGYIRFA